MRAFLLNTLVVGAWGVTLQQRREAKCAGCDCPYEEQLTYDAATQLYIAVGGALLGNETEGNMTVRNLWGTGSDILVTQPYALGDVWVGNQTGSPKKERIDYYTYPVDAIVGRDYLKMGGCKVISDVYMAEEGRTWSNLRIAGLGPVPEEAHPYLVNKTDQRIAFCLPEDNKQAGLVKFGAADASPRASSRPSDSKDDGNEDTGVCAKTPGCSFISELLSSILEAIQKCFCAIFKTGCDSEANTKGTKSTSKQMTVLHVHGGLRQHHWSVTLRNVSLLYPDGRKARVVKGGEEPSTPEDDPDNYWVALFDTGTPNIMVPKAIIEQLNSIVSVEVPDRNACKETFDKLPALVFELDSAMKDSAFLTIRPADYLRESNCRVKMSDTDQSGYKNVFVLGLPAMRGKTTTFDYRSGIDTDPGRKITLVDNQGAPCPEPESHKHTQSKLHDDLMQGTSVSDRPFVSAVNWHKSPRV